MGANRFYDFLLIHKYLGLATMVSLEQNPVMYERAIFNCPYSFIQVEPKSAAQFIAEDEFNVGTILWLDYDGGIGPSITNDVASLSTKLKVGDFCFVTVYGGPPGAINRASDQERLAWLQDQLGDLATAVNLQDVQTSAFAIAVHKVLIAAFRNAFAMRRDGRFIPILQVEYSDSVPMITVGGGLLADGQAVTFLSRVKQSLPFLKAAESELYEIKSLHLTERERALFDRVTTRPNKRNSRERNQLTKLGFSDVEFQAYKDLLRYLPRYVETMV
jgi:hypothetical protein